MMEKRLNIRLVDLWEMLSKGAPPPDFTHFNPNVIHDIWPQCLALAFDPKGGSKIVHLGKQIAPLLSGLKEGSAFSPQMKVFPAARLIQHVPDVLTTFSTLTDEGQFVNTTNKVVKYRSCLLPFGDKESGVTHVVMGISWREF